MKLYVEDERLTSPIQPATRLDRLRADGWIPCGTCGGNGVDPSHSQDCDCNHPTQWNRCPDCAYGLVPPGGMVEAAAKGMHSLYNESAVDWVDETDKTFYRGAARAVLIAAARWEATDE